MPLELQPQGIFRVYSNNRGGCADREAISNFTIQLTASVNGDGSHAKEGSGFLAKLKRFHDGKEK